MASNGLLRATFGPVTGRLRHYASEQCTEKNGIFLAYSSTASRNSNSNRLDAGKVYSTEKKQMIW